MRRENKSQWLNIFLAAKLLSCLAAFCFLFFPLAVFAQQQVIHAGISIDKVPNEFYGTWRVESQLVSTNAPERFKANTVDLWNLSRAGDVITLDNPFSGAHASIMVDSVNNKTVKFKKIGDYDNQKLTDTVQVTLGKETFTGTNTLKMDTVSQLDGHVLKSETATYKLKGEKISGSSVKLK